MPRTRKYGRKRSAYRKKRTYKRRSVAAKTVKQLRTQLGIGKPETKVNDVISGSTTVSTALTAMDYHFSSLGQGLTNLDRIGRVVTIKSFKFRMGIVPDPANTDSGLVRLIYVLQYSPNNTSGSINALMTAEQVLQTSTDIFSPYQFDQNGYKILYDQTFSFPAGENGSIKALDVSLPVRNLNVEWTETDTTGNSTNLKKGYIRGFIMYYGFGGSPPLFDLWQRTIFLDG